MPGLAARLRERFHGARARLFVALMRPAPGSRLLDLGGSDGSLSARICADVPLDVTVADLTADHAAAVRARGFRHAVLEDGPLPFRPGDFDLVLCNSVIEHVTMSKEQCRVDVRVDQQTWFRTARRRQREFAAEIMKLGASYFVQTPHRHFPVEQHVHLPFIQYLSHNGLCRVVSMSDRWWIKSCGGVVDWELLTAGDMQRIFPDAAIHVERFMGLPKSIVAWRRLENAQGRRP
jgi:cyclopropane fatty-acyl-phospholipid synthase-like methyltransferase